MKHRMLSLILENPVSVQLRSAVLSGAMALLVFSGAQAQKKAPFFVNGEGVVISRSNNREIAFFGVNYSPAFGHGYRALKQLGYDHKKVIDQDVYHFARLGLDAFRIHLWDTEITDSLGNIIDNQQLELFDYLVSALKTRNINIIVTPLTLYDNGYPDGATKTTGFANYITKGEAPRNKNFRPVLKTYLGQVLHRKNRYTGMSLSEDAQVTAVELFNEPHHSGEESEITAYIDELTDFVRKSGWTKPVFYNIAENPHKVDAVLASRVDGISFQWYPGGLVGGRALEHNFMPYINDYPIPFSGRKGWAGKALMIYEFDAADNAKNYAYPLMARSLREAGFQWATQFAYDPAPLAAYNSDYQTHFLNLSYTPGRAISMLIAGEVFRQTPRKKQFVHFLADTVFGAFTISHKQNLSELNSGEKFYYTSSTASKPASPGALKHIAGTGSSPVVSYSGSGAYFLDKLSPDMWRLEVMPDVIPVSNPFDKPSLNKKVGHIEWNQQHMSIRVPGIPADFFAQGINAGNSFKGRATGFTISIIPGTYLISAVEHGDTKTVLPAAIAGLLKMEEFHAPPADSIAQPVVINHTKTVQQAGKDVEIEVSVSGLKGEHWLTVIAYPLTRRAENFELKKKDGNRYAAVLPASFASEGLIRYWITIAGANGQYVYPGGHKGSPWDWNYYHDASWTMELKPSGAPRSLFKAASGFEAIHYTFAPWSEPHSRKHTFDTKTGGLSIALSTEVLSQDNLKALGFSAGAAQHAVIQQDGKLRISAHSLIERNQTITVTMVNDLGLPFSADAVLVPGSTEIVLNMEAFSSGRTALIPRPYPTFLPYWFTPGTVSSVLNSTIEVVQLALLPEKNKDLLGSNVGFAVSEITYLAPGK
jgi:hypothetical protein